jgi:hypothetical protein
MARMRFSLLETQRDGVVVKAPVHRLSRKTMILLVPVIVCVAAVVIYFGRGASSAQPNSQPSAASVAAQGAAHVEANLPTPSLPADQAAAWRAAWQSMADCMQSHGVPDFPNAPATFGDGKTPPPNIAGAPGTPMDPTSSTYQSAKAACPFDTSGLSQSEFQQSWQNWEATHPANADGSSTSATGGGPPAGP